MRLAPLGELATRHAVAFRFRAIGDRVLVTNPEGRWLVLTADEFDAYTRLLERHDNLWLDTTMVASNYFALEVPRRIFEVRPERILYGTDFPNLPYAGDRELKTRVGMKFRDDVEAGFLGQNALRLFEGA